MKRLRQSLWLWLAGTCFFAAPASAYYVIPFRLKLRGQPRFTVTAVLADHYARYFGEQDALRELMLNHYHPDPTGYAEGFLTRSFSWYADRIRENPRIYGAHAEPIIAGLQSRESILDGLSSVIVFGEPHNPERPIVILRESAPGPDGRTPSEHSFRDRGLDGEMFPAAPVEFRWARLARMQPSPHLPDHFPFELFERDPLDLFLFGAKKEFKNFSMSIEYHELLFPYLYLTGRMLKFLTWSGQPFPARVTHWPDGRPIDSAAREHYGMRVSRVQLDAYGPLLRRWYAGKRFKHWRTLNNEHTRGLDLNFMWAEVDELDAVMNAIVSDRFDGRGPHEREWLVHDKERARTLASAIGCPSRVAAPPPVRRRRRR